MTTLPQGHYLFSGEHITDAIASGIQLGITNGSEVPPGYVGEFMSSIRDVAHALPLANGQTLDVTSITLTPGIWNVWGSVYIDPTQKADLLGGWVHDVSATRPDGTLGGLMITSGSLTNDINGIYTGIRRFNVTVSTPVYLGAQLGLQNGTCIVAGSIFAERVR